MKLFGILVGATIFVNVYVLWRLNEQSTALTTAIHALESASREQKPADFEETSTKEGETISFLEMEVAGLNSRLQAMEQAYAELESGKDDAFDAPEDKSNRKSLVESIQSANNSAADEEWFWSRESTDEDISMSFHHTQGFSVNSVVCRSDWCRVEVEDTSDEANDLISGLELQLRINESLGRNTVIKSGASNGRHRVLFIQ